MKKLLLILLAANALWFVACNETENLNPETEGAFDSGNKVANQRSSGLPDWDDFDYIPTSILEQARDVWGDVPPAVTIAFSYNNASLEDGWTFAVYSPDESCIVGEASPYYPYYPDYNFGYLTTEDGFVFLEEDDLCGEGGYSIDNRQGGWFDYVCGPQGKSFDYQGEPMFVYINLWCE